MLSGVLPPLWLMYPNISQYSIGWRMGYGESYRYKLGDWLNGLSAAERARWEEMFPPPRLWQAYEEEDDADETEHTAGTAEEDCAADDDGNWSAYVFGNEHSSVGYWTKGGIPAYPWETLAARASATDGAGPFAFPFAADPDALAFCGCADRWQPVPFSVDMWDCTCVGQYVLAELALLCGDEELSERLLECSDTVQLQWWEAELQRTAPQLWEACGHALALNGLYFALMQHETYRTQLMAAAADVFQPAADEEGWRWLSVCLEVRDELRRVCAHWDAIDWEAARA